MAHGRVVSGDNASRLYAENNTCFHGPDGRDPWVTRPSGPFLVLETVSSLEEPERGS